MRDGRGRLIIRENSRVKTGWILDWRETRDLHVVYNTVLGAAISPI